MDSTSPVSLSAVSPTRTGTSVLSFPGGWDINVLGGLYILVSSVRDICCTIAVKVFGKKGGGRQAGGWERGLGADCP